MILLLHLIFIKLDKESPLKAHHTRRTLPKQNPGQRSPELLSHLILYHRDMLNKVRRKRTVVGAEILALAEEIPVRRGCIGECDEVRARFAIRAGQMFPDGWIDISVEMDSIHRSMILSQMGQNRPHIRHSRR